MPVVDHDRRHCVDPAGPPQFLGRANFVCIESRLQHLFGGNRIEPGLCRGIDQDTVIAGVGIVGEIRGEQRVLERSLPPSDLRPV